LEPVLVITIDTEGDNLWENPTAPTTANARYIPRFQNLCESYGFKPTYLVDYEMASDAFFQDFGRGLLESGVAEIGTHLHAWNTPPLSDETSGKYSIYITELPYETILLKMTFMTQLLTEVFHSRPISHRGGRWGFDEQVAHALSKLGYLVDCSVTPGVSWRHHKGNPRGKGGPDYSDFSIRPYFLDLTRIRFEGISTILEVPVTIEPTYSRLFDEIYQRLGKRWYFLQRAANRLKPPHIWLRPNGHNLDAMIDIVDWGMRQNLPVLHMMLHSSELMPGASPNFRRKGDIEKLYDDLDHFFSNVLARKIGSATLAEYRQAFRRNG
jgi:hypothetical protein